MTTGPLPPRAPDPSRTGRVLLSAGLVGGVLVVAAVLLAVIAAGDRRAGFSPSADLRRVLSAAGLTVCGDGPSATRADQAIDAHAYTVGLRCDAGATVDVVGYRFGNAADRDAAVRQFEVIGRPRASGAAYTFGDLAVLVHGAGPQQVHRRITTALRAAGGR